MTDTPGRGRPHQDDDQLRHTLTIHEVGARLTAAGLPRSERQIKRYCETGFLDAKKIPGPSGEQWFVAPAALPKLIGDLQQWQMQRPGHGQPRPGMSDSVTPEIPRDSAPDTAGHGRLEPAVAGREAAAEGKMQSDTSGDVVRLEREVESLKEDRVFLREQIKVKDKQLEVKDQQITSMLERDRETNILIQRLQEGLLLGPTRHEEPPQHTRREEPRDGTSPQS